MPPLTSQSRMDLPPRVPARRVGWDERANAFTASADLTLSALDAALVRHNRFFPIDGPLDGDLSSLLAYDSAGPLALGYGGWRDLLAEVQYHDKQNRLVTAVGDDAKALVNARIPVVTFTALAFPRPEAGLAARAELDTDLTVIRPRPHWTILTRSALWVGYQGGTNLIEEATAYFESKPKIHLVRDDALGIDALRRRLWTWPETADFLRLRITLPPTALRPFVLAAKLIEWTADPWQGQLLATVPHHQIKEVRQAATNFEARIELFDSN